jgi:hypothetical protein
MREPDLGSWILPQPIQKRKYVAIPRLKKNVEIPFGYYVDEIDNTLLQPIPKELDALEQAKKYLKTYSYTEVSAWLTKQTGRKISRDGLSKRLKGEVARRKKRGFYRALAERYKKALQSAAKYEERLGQAEQTGWFYETFYQSLSRDWEGSSDTGEPRS